MTPEQRQRSSRILGLLALAAIAWVGFRFVGQTYPVEIRLTYRYDDVPRLPDLAESIVEIHDHEARMIARTSFFHAFPPASATAKPLEQKLALLAGRYTIRFFLRYNDGSSCKARETLALREGGGRYILRVASGLRCRQRLRSSPLR